MTTPIETTDEEQDSHPLLADDRGGALFGPNNTYRYLLRRDWDVDRPTVAFIMLNPSTADGYTDDPTIRRCLDYAKKWGYGSLVVGNLFALRSTDPMQLYDHPDPIGPENDEQLQQICEMAEKVIAAWGAKGSLHERGREVAAMLDVDLLALDTTKSGHPNHPLYQPKGIEPEPFGYDNQEVSSSG